MSDLDELKDRDPLSLSDQDIGKIVDDQRKQRARRAAGEKVTKPKGPSIDISSITKKLVADAKPEIKITRRI